VFDVATQTSSLGGQARTSFVVEIASLIDATSASAAVDSDRYGAAVHDELVVSIDCGNSRLTSFHHASRLVFGTVNRATSITRC
jgi:hypothetical protein